MCFFIFNFCKRRKNMPQPHPHNDSLYQFLPSDFNCNISTHRFYGILRTQKRWNHQNTYAYFGTIRHEVFHILKVKLFRFFKKKLTLHYIRQHNFISSNSLMIIRFLNYFNLSKLWILPLLLCSRLNFSYISIYLLITYHPIKL